MMATKSKGSTAKNGKTTPHAFPTPVTAACPSGSCRAPDYNACAFGTAYLCTPAEAAARATIDPLVADLSAFGPQVTCVFPGGGCTSTTSNACVFGGGRVQHSGCCPGAKCVRPEIPGFMSSGCPSGGWGDAGAAGVSAKLERKAVLDIPGMLDKYTFGSERGSCHYHVENPHPHPYHHHHHHHKHPPAPAPAPAPAHASMAIFDGSVVVPGGGGSAAVAPIIPAALPFPPAASASRMPTMGVLTLNGAGTTTTTSIYAPIMVPNNTGTVTITNSMTAGPGPAPPAPTPAPAPAPAPKPAPAPAPAPAPSNGSVGASSGFPFVPFGPGPVFPGSGSSSASAGFPFVPFGPGPVISGSGSASGSAGFPFVPFGPGPVISGGGSASGSAGFPFVPFGPGPVLGGAGGGAGGGGGGAAQDVPVPATTPPVDVANGVPVVTLTTIKFANKRGSKTSVTNVVAGAKTGTASLEAPKTMLHGASTRLKQSSKDLAADGLVVLVDAEDDEGETVGGVFHLPVGALLAKQTYVVPPTMSTSSRACALQAVRNGHTLDISLI